MRIRKNAKISPLFYAAAPGTVIQTYDCQFNQSPWDAMSFSSPSTLPPPRPSQVYGNDTHEEGINGSSFDSISVSHSASEKAEQYESATDQMAERPVNVAKKSDDMPIICCKTNGRNWHCRKKAVNGTPFCEHHLSQYNNSSTHSTTTKKQVVIVPEVPKRRGRPRKQAPVLSSNPNEYYYYMDFRQSWKKRRGERSSQDTDIEMVDGESERKMGPVKVSKFADDYVDWTDDEDEDEEEEHEAGRKRARKPVKARSLKSLM